MLRRIPGGATGEDEVIAGLERFHRKPGLLETRGIRPFSGKLLPVPVLVYDGQMEPRVRILELKGNDVALDRNLLLLHVLSRKRVVG